MNNTYPSITEMRQSATNLFRKTYPQLKGGEILVINEKIIGKLVFSNGATEIEGVSNSTVLYFSLYDVVRYANAEEMAQYKADRADYQNRVFEYYNKLSYTGD